MKILTYNMRNWRDDPWSVWESRRTPMVDQFKKFDPDIILLQEVCQAVDNPNPDNSMFCWLHQQLPDYIYFQYADNSQVYYNPNFDNRPENEGLAILSKIPAQSSETIPLGTVADDGNPRICFANYFEHFNSYNCHLSTSEDGRELNIKNFNAAVGVDKIGLINGDLNTTDKDPIFEDLPTWTDLWKVLGPNDGFTFGVPISAQHPLKLDERIDYFLAGAAILKTAKNIGIAMDVQDGSGYYASDHLGVIAEFSV